MSDAAAPEQEPVPDFPATEPERFGERAGELDLTHEYAATRQRRRIAAQRRAAAIVATMPPPRPPIG